MASWRLRPRAAKAWAARRAWMMEGLWLGKPSKNERMFHWLVVGIPTPLKNDGIRQLGLWKSQYMEKNVPNHKPVHLHHLIGGSFNPPEKYEFVRLDHPNYWGKEKMFQTTRFSPRFSVRMPAQFVERGNAVSGTSTGTFSAVQPSYCHMERPWAGYSVPQHLGHRDRPSVCWATVQPQPEHRSPTAMRPLA